MSKCVAFLVLCLFFLGSHEVFAVDDLGYLREWNGMYGDSPSLNNNKLPSDTFMKDKNIIKLVKSSLPQDIVKILVDGWKAGSVGGTIQVVDDILIYHKCRPHMCPDDWITLYVDLKNGKIQCVSCQYDDIKKYKDKFPAGYSPARWYVTKEPTIIGIQGMIVDDLALYKKLNK